ncbi:hypothetical protein IFM61606_06177 [Aspergillus udagawae]|nr:hypothetical protein IFM61606_06177 [Aspergillus udagawae]
MQMLRKHPEIETIEYPFVDTYYFGQEALTLRRNDCLQAVKQRVQADPALAQTFQEAFSLLEQSIQSVQAKVDLLVLLFHIGYHLIEGYGGQGKTPFIKEHAFTFMKPETISRSLAHPHPYRNTPQITAQPAKGRNERATEIGEEDANPTMLPTQFLRSVTAVFLIRHPALVFESILRVSGPTMGARVDDQEFPVEASMRWLRVLYDCYTTSAGGGVQPIVLNADEIMAHPVVVQQLCQQLQLDPAGVRFQWDPVPPAVIESQSAYQQHFFSTIQSSCGVRLDKHSAAQGQSLDLDALTATWQEVYGMQTAATLRSLVDAAMPDYEYLCGYELRASDLGSQKA